MDQWLVNGLGIPSCPISSTWMSRWKLVNDWLVNGLEPILINMAYCG